jgi:hypothetical protein
MGESDAPTPRAGTGALVDDAAPAPPDVGERCVDARHVKREMVNPGTATFEELGDGRGCVRRLDQFHVGIPYGDECNADPIRRDILRRAVGGPDEGTPALDRRRQVGDRDADVVELQFRPPLSRPGRACARRTAAARRRRSPPRSRRR